MPYKSKAANVLEVVVQLNFLILLLLELTTFVQTDLFLFSGDTSDGVCGNAFSSISYIVILLAPVYYAPLLVLIVVVVVYLIIYSKRLECNVLRPPHCLILHTELCSSIIQVQEAFKT